MIGLKVEVYRNLHTQCFSVRHKGRVIDAAHSIMVRDAKFIVQPAGRAKVLREKRKNVHAFVRGTVVDELVIKIGPQITYNPYKRDSFFYKSNGKPIHKAALVMLVENRIYLVKEVT